MDEVSRSFYALTFKVQFMEKNGEAFQDFFSTIMEKRYPGDFIRVRPTGSVGDRKNDGILPSKRMLFQCYAPNELKTAACIAKIDEDFHGALIHWRKHFDTWVFVHNDRSGLGPDVTAKLLTLSASHKGPRAIAWGFEELRQEVSALDEPALVSLFGAAPSRRAMMDLGLSDLVPVLDHIVRLSPTGEADLRPVPADKLEYNQLSRDAAELLRTGMQRAPLIRRYFQRSPREQDKLAASFHKEYGRLRAGAANPDDIFRSLQVFAGGEHVSSTTRQTAILACLAFFFEECDIFDRPEEVDAP
jgi:hypothetical protein